MQRLARRCAVVGHPAAHSLTPALYQAAFAELGLDWKCEAIDVPAGGLPDFVAGLGPEWAGLAVTMPHKPAAAELGRPDQLVRRLGVANTIVFGADGPQAYNTDVAGFVQALAYRRFDDVADAVLLGAGATARAALLALDHLGVSAITAQVRDVTRADQLAALAADLGVTLAVEPLGTAHETELLISTLPGDAAGQWSEGAVAMAQSIFDASYNPWPTPLTVAAVDAGRPVATGLDLLAGQAVFQLDLIVGDTVDFELLYRAGKQQLARQWHD